MRAYVTTVGTSPEAVFNPLWYLAEAYDWIPDEVYLFWNDDVRGHLEKVVALIKRLSRAYKHEISIKADESTKFEESNPVMFRKTVAKVLVGLKRKNYEVVVDITPGRKFMSALLMSSAFSVGVGDITYLHLNNWLDYRGKLLFEVPMVKQRLFTKEELTGRNGVLQSRRRKPENPGNFTVTREELMVPLNSLYLDGTREFTLSVGDVGIGTVKLSREARLELEEFIELDEDIHGGYHMVKEATISGGMAPFRNWDGFVKLVRELKNQGRPLYVGFDTNALYFRVPSKILAEKRFYEGGNLIFDFVYSGEVQLETGRSLNKKLPFSGALGKYSNQPTPRARLSALGLSELDRLRRLGAERADSGENFHGDTRIILDYKAFAEEKNANVIVLTTDDKAYAEMEALKGTGLAPFRLEWNFSRKLRGSWEALRDTLYTTVVLLGELSFAHYSLDGIWHGKNSNDWLAERVKLGNFEYGRLLRVLG